MYFMMVNQAHIVNLYGEKQIDHFKVTDLKKVSSHGLCHRAVKGHWKVWSELHDTNFEAAYTRVKKPFFVMETFKKFSAV